MHIPNLCKLLILLRFYKFKLPIKQHHSNEYTVAYFKVYNLRALGHLGLFGLGLNKLTFLKGKEFLKAHIYFKLGTFGIYDTRILLTFLMLHF